jgi:GTP:adenosylcobinamide-phosphate guanylyltransferase
MHARLIVLAAQRPGIADPLAAAFGVSHKCLVPVCGKPLIAHVLGTIAAHRKVDGIRVSIEPAQFGTIDAIARRVDPSGRIACVASADNLADSVMAAATGAVGPIIITTADNALLTPTAIDAMLEALKGDTDVAIAMAPRDAVLAAHPNGQRRFYRFRDDAYSNCNLYGLSGTHALAAAEIFRGGGQFAKKAKRIVAAFGLVNLILLRLRVCSLAGGLARISGRIGLRIVPVVLRDGRNAIDVDNERTHKIVSALIAAAV